MQLEIAMGASLVDSGTLAPNFAAMEAERKQMLASLTIFKKFNSLTFDREIEDLWIVETWVDNVEKLLEHLYVLEQDKVHLVAHYLE